MRNNVWFNRIRLVVAGLTVMACLSCDDAGSGASQKDTTVTADGVGDTVVPPDTVQPDTVQPDTVQPDTVQPDTVQPDTVQPDTVQPDTVLDTVEPDTVLDTVEPDTVLDTVEPDTLLPDTVLPDTVLPDTVLPDTVLPDTVLPDAEQPDAANGDSADPDAAVDAATDAPAGDAIVTVLDNKGAPLPTATVKIGELSVQVDQAGNAHFGGLSPGSVVAVAQAPGYTAAAQSLAIVAGSKASGLIVLQKIGQTKVILTVAGTTTQLSAGQVNIDLPADTFVTADGTTFTGSVTVDVTALDPALGLAGAPGPLVGTPAGGSAPQPLEVAFLADVSFSTPDGKALQLAAGKAATLSFVLPDSASKTFSIGQSVPAWYFDTSKAKWVQDGAGAVSMDTSLSKKVFTAKVSHFTWWMGALPISQTGCLNVAVEQDGAATPGVQVVAEGVDYASASQGTTGPDGKVCLEVKTDGTVRLRVQDAIRTQVGGPVLLVADAAPQSCGGNCQSAEIEVAGATACTGAPDCDDQNPCTEDTCGQDGLCSHQAADGGCDDGAPCTQDDACVAGGCVGQAKNCDDGSACTTDTCDAAGDCKHAWLEEGAPCDDGQPCTMNTHCSVGACQGQSKSCDDNNPCTEDYCDWDTGECAADNADGDESECSDDNACTSGDTCVSGSCVGTLVGCDDGNPCTVDPAACDPAAACTHTDVTDGTACSDASACSGGDVCASGKCVGTAIDCGDGDACTNDDCDNATGCYHEPKVCDDADPCTNDSCDSDGGGCDYVSMADGSPCDDTFACTTGETCAAGLCGDATSLNDDACDDDNACTINKCTAGGCTVLYDAMQGKPCYDGACYVGVCDMGSCAHGGPNTGPVDCDDGVPCTTDSCDPVTGCHHEDLADGSTCDNHDACDGGADVCKSLACIGTAPLDCDDDNPCTKDSCSGTSGCMNVALAEGDPCGTDSCEQGGTCQAGACAGGTPIDCDDDDACTIDSCDPAAGCAHAAKDCDDDNVCTEDSCSSGDCGHSPIPQQCDDGNPCSVGDACTPDGTCVGFVPGTCDDGNACTMDSEVCDPVAGCTHTPDSDGIACSDNSPCTENDACAQGTCSGVQIDCDDDDVCTDDYCDAWDSGGCVHWTCNDWNSCTADVCDPLTGDCSYVPLPVDATCDDDSLCSTGDSCATGSCEGEDKCEDDSKCTDDHCDWQTGTCLHVEVCDDEQPCTLDSCDPVTGQCGHEPLDEGAACDDGNDCTIGEKCGANVCEGGQVGADGTPCLYSEMGSCTGSGMCQGNSCIPAGYVCDDENPCTDDVCKPGFGCTHFTHGDGATCSDGDPCSENDTCQAGACDGSPLDCDDDQPCTADSCEDGECVHQPAAEGGACDDGVACTADDKCAAGACAGTPANTACDDGSACTEDVCTTTGCTNAAKTCDDGDKCTTDSCDPATGCATEPKNCEDGNTCTTNSCNPATGNCKLIMVGDFTPCDDGDKCHGDADICLGGVCKVNGANKICLDENVCTSDTCNPATAACEHPVLEDGTVCSGQADVCNMYFTCQTGSCEAYNPINCDDGNSCTIDSCDNVGGTGVCSHGPDLEYTVCGEVADRCTIPAMCDAYGTCGSQTQKTCDDNDPCTTDSCDPNAPVWLTECSNEPIPGCTP